MRALRSLGQLCIKELRSLWADKVLLAFLLFGLNGSVYIAGTSSSQELRRAPVAVVDEDRTPLSRSIAAALLPPQFLPPEALRFDQMDRSLDSGRHIFALVIPAGFQRDVAAGRSPALQVNLDATAVSQTTLGASYLQAIVNAEVQRFLVTEGVATATPVQLRVRIAFNPTLDEGRFAAVMELVSNVTLLAIVLAGAAVIREREHGTLEHLLVMPVRPNEIMLAKVLANGAVMLACLAVSLLLILDHVLGMSIRSATPLFLLGAALHIFASGALGILLATLARSMPQLGLLIILIIMPMQMLSGGLTPTEAMPDWLRQLMLAAPTTHFTAFAQGVLYRGAGLSIVWPQVLALLLLGSLCYGGALLRFRRSLR